MRARGKVPITLDRERFIFFDYNAVATFEREIGMALMELISMAEERSQGEHGELAVLKVFGARYVRELLWAGLLHEDERLTPRKVGMLIERHAKGETFLEKLTYVTQPVFEAFGYLLSREGDSKNLTSAVGEDPHRASTGTNSSE